jgi:hypothetical protein
MAVKKKPNFSNFTKRTVNKPSSMDEFLKGVEDVRGPEIEARQVPKKPEPSPSGSSHQPLPTVTEPEIPALQNESIEGQGVKTDASKDDDSTNLMDSLTYSTTVSFNPEIMDALELLWMKLKRSAPAGKKKKFSKSLLINLMISNSMKEIDSTDGQDHPVVTALMKTIKG